MQFDSLGAFLASAKETMAKGPVCLILAEDDVELATTIGHHLRQGFRKVVVVGDGVLKLPGEIAPKVIRVIHDMLAEAALETVVNGCIRAAPGIWFAYCYNAEYLFYPFCEHRTVGELTAFCMEERRDHVPTYVIDLYAGDLAAHPSAVALDDAHIDRTGYYALRRTDRENNVAIRQLDFFGGLRWRFEEHIPYTRRRIDRMGLFRAAAGLELRPDHTFNIAEYNTYACEWHNSPTAAICSFRTAKALRRNPGSRAAIHTFRWHNTTAFAWHSRQLLDLGLMEPGQWF